MAAIPTVKVKAETDLGFMIINESDYDSKIHTLYVEGGDKTTKTEAKAETKPATGGRDASRGRRSGKSE